MSQIIRMTEHEIPVGDKLNNLVALGLHGFMEKPINNKLSFLGLSETLSSSYYIGLAHLTEDVKLMVLPKINRLGYMEMLRVVFSEKSAASYFSDYYGIGFDESAIECSAEDDYLTPFLIIAFVASVRAILDKGLKRGYVVHEENLNEKIKGKLCLSSHISKNLSASRFDRAYCRFQEYSVDIPENRILKHALRFSKSYITSIASPVLNKELSDIIAELQLFRDVSEINSVWEIKTVRKNRIYKEYNNAINLARLILRRFDYALSQSQNQIIKCQPYWIDMSRLFEVYVLHQLRKAFADSILFQVKGAQKTQVDFVKTDEKIILDAKYKPYYESSQHNIIADVREISGYARDVKILKTMGISEDDQYIPTCIIIYPAQTDTNLFDCHKLLKNQLNTKIKGFTNFYKLGIRLPDSPIRN